MQQRFDRKNGSGGGAEPLALVCLGAVPWGRSWKRIQSMVYQLSRTSLFDRVVFVNPHDLWIRKVFTERDLPMKERFARLGGIVPRQVAPGLRVLTMAHFLPGRGPFVFGRRAEEKWFRHVLRRQIGNRPFVLLNNHPNFFSRELLEDLMDRAALTVFDMSDDFVEYHRIAEHRELIAANVRFSCSHSDLVFTINEHVKQKYGDCNPNTFVVANSTNYENFDREKYERIAFMEAIRAQGQPVLGYTGIINSARVDYALLTTLLERRRDWQFVFVGSADRSFHDLVARHPNLHHHQQVDYGWLPDFIAAFDVTVIPFQVNEHTRGNDLLKFNDYLAMGKSIVTTDTGGAQKYASLLRIAHSADEFEAHVEEALREEPSEETVARRKDTARRNSWSARATEIEAILRRHLGERQAHAAVIRMQPASQPQ